MEGFPLHVRVQVVRGTYEGRAGVVTKETPMKVTLTLDPPDGKEVTIMKTSVERESEAATVVPLCSDGESCGLSEDDSLLSTTADTTLGSEEATFFGRQPISYIQLGKPKPRAPACFLRWAFQDVLEVRQPDLKAEIELNPVFHGRGYELCASKIDSDGASRFGSNDVLRLFYVPSDLVPKGVQPELEKFADFSKLQDPCKVAARLELLISSAQPANQHELHVDDFELIEEPQASVDAGGCGFIPGAMLDRLLGGARGASARSRRATAIQIRMVAPKLGVFKGVLTRKEDISRIQLPPSMLKVGAAADSKDDWAWLLVMRDYPSKTSLQVAKWMRGEKIRKDFRSTPLSPMLQRLMATVGLSKDDIKQYSRKGHRKESWVVGCSDPTNSLPSGHVFINGLLPENTPCKDGQTCVFVTRSPCTKSDDGKLLPAIVEQPAGMSDTQWQSLQERPFGEIIFANGGSQAIPMTISDGDLDGDLYFVCWDADIISKIDKGISRFGECAMPDPTTSGSDEKDVGSSRSCLGSDWFRRAREYMCDCKSLESKRLIGRLYRAGEEIADRSPDGLDNEDAIAYFKAYVQAIDAGKHGNTINLPEHLRKRVGM